MASANREGNTNVKIAVYGASGYTGRLVAAELRRRGIDAVLSGRDEERIRAAASRAGLGDVEVRAADVNDRQALVAALRGCDAVINCVGPFLALGAQVVAAAIAAGCHYADTSAEQLFVKRVFDEFGDGAEAAGVTVVPATGYDILPGDLAAHLAGERVEPVDELTIAYDVSDFGMTRGTLRSAFEMLTGEKLSYAGGSWHTGERPARRATVAFPGPVGEVPVMSWPGCEVVSVPRHVRTRHVEVVVNASAATAEFLQLLQSPPEIAHKIIDGLPEGPDSEQRRMASFTIVAEAVGADGRRSRAVVRGKDIYGCTAVIAVEGARSLVTHGQPAGVLSPAQAYDIPGFLRFLSSYGFSYSLEALEPAPPR